MNVNDSTDPSVSQAESKVKIDVNPDTNEQESADQSPGSDAEQQTEVPADSDSDASRKAESPAADGDAGVDETPASSPDESEETSDDVEEPVYQAGMNWFVLRVASNKENYVRETLLRKVQIEGLSDRVGRILVPTEKTKSVKGGKQRIVETKLYPGYGFVEMKLEDDGRIPQDVFFLIKETTGVGDFVGTAGRPAPMSRPEVEKMLHDSKAPEETPQVKVEFKKGDIVRITEGPFENNEGTVDEVFPEKGIVKVLVTIFGRQVPVEVEYWVISPVED